MPDPKTPPRLEPHEFAEDYQHRVGDDLILLDVRQPFELMQEGYLAGSLNIPTNQLQERVWDEVPQDKTVVVYCAHGVRSYQVSMALKQAGWQDVYDIQGGIDLWERAGLPVKRDT
jgi:rhodanese-related sulfurtransferase